MDSKRIHGGDIERVARTYGFDTKDILDFSSNINPLPLPQVVKEYLYKHFAMLTRYPDRHYFELRQALAFYTKVPLDYLMVGNGATELIYLAVQTIQPKRVLLPAPSFGEYEGALQNNNCEIIYYQLPEKLGFKLDLSNFLAVLQKGFDLLIFCNPNNPTGQLINKSDMLTILKEAQRTNTFVLLDESFIEFVPDEEDTSVLDAFADFENVVVLRAFTKFFALPGLRLGYCTAPPSLIERLADRKEPWTVNGIASLLGPLLLQQIEFIRQSREWINSERPYFSKRLQQLNKLKVYETYANFILLRLLEKGATVQDLQEKLESRGIMIRNAESFRYLDNTYFRLAIKDRTSNMSLISNLEDLL